MSRPTGARGLKCRNLVDFIVECMSRPTGARGLKFLLDTARFF